MGKREQVLKKIDLKNSTGLELGPLHAPVVHKSEAKVYYVDHATRDDLIKKYKGHPFDLDNIVDVDYVIAGTTLKKITKGKKFDFVIASHVIEHIPDVVTWLNDIASVLNEGGVLSLVIPDKRYCFDVARNESRPADIIGAYLDKISKTTSTMMYDYESEFRDVGPLETWKYGRGAATAKPREKELLKAWESCQRNLKPNVYVDAHCYTFTPESFFNIVRRLMFHNLINFEVVSFKDTAQNEQEFYVTLKKTSNKSYETLSSSIPKVRSYTERDILLEQVKILKKELDSTSTVLQGVYESFSWKATRPLREVSNMLKKIKRG